jgi:hypothetical protein
LPELAPLDPPDKLVDCIVDIVVPSWIVERGAELEYINLTIIYKRISIKIIKRIPFTSIIYNIPLEIFLKIYYLIQVY